MNGDIGKLAPGAVYPATPEPLGHIVANSNLDYNAMNGTPVGTELLIDTNLDSTCGQHNIGAAIGFSTLDQTSLADVSNSSTGQMADLSATGIPLEQLKQMLSSQLEYYFSRENLANDAYLLSQMDNDQYVPIWTVANFNQVKKLTKDIKLITEVLRESPNVQVDEEGQKVRPNHKRCIVILREIPDNTPLEDVKNLFSGEGCPRFISCEFAHNSSWYVTFESDEDAQKAYRFLREEVREFQGKPIMARIKAKPMNRLPMPTVANVGGLKNGYRTPPPQAVYDPNSYPTGQQRFLYTNGTTLPQTTMSPYPNQVHVYHQPFYHAGMMPWGPASPAAYFDMPNVFTINGITPHNSYKPHNPRHNSRNRNKPRNGAERGNGGGGGGGVTEVGPGGGGGGGSGIPMNRPTHPQMSGGSVTGVPIGTTTTTPSYPCPALPVTTTKPVVVSSYQTGNAKFHSLHSTASPTVESQYNNNSNNQPHHHPKGGGSSILSQDSDSQTVDTNIQFTRHRVHRRTKDQDSITKTNNNNNNHTLPSIRESINPSTPASSNNAQCNRGVQFDLEASAFPPLPGLDAVDLVKSHNNVTDTVGGIENGSAGGSGISNSGVGGTGPTGQSQQNRLSDVVKGTAKFKSFKDKESIGGAGMIGSQQTTSNSSRSTSPGFSNILNNQIDVGAVNNPSVVGPSGAQTSAISSSNSSQNNTTNTVADVVPSTVNLTPPSSPDKSIKTDDSNMVNGIADEVVTSTCIPTTASCEDPEPVTRCDCNVPPTVPHNSHSQNTVVVAASAFPIDLSRPSYAQVAQHCREIPSSSCTKHKNDERDGNV